MSASSKSSGIGVWGLTAIIIGNIVGSGIFLLPSSMAIFGTMGILGWIVAAIGSIAVALVFASLARKANVEGGLYSYIYRIFGRFLGQQASFIYWAYVWTGNLAIVIACVGYIMYFFPALGFYGGNILAIIIIWITTLINLRGLKTYVGFQMVTTVIKMIPLIFIAVVGWFFIHPEYYSQYANLKPHMGAISIAWHAALYAMWAFVGMESATMVASKVKNPTRTVPVALIISIVVIAIVYIAGAMAMLGMIPAPTLATETAPYAVAAKMILGSWGGGIIAIGAIVSTLGALNGWTLMQGEALATTSKDGLLPQFLKKRNSKGIPVNGILVTTAIETLYLIGATFLTPSHHLVAEFSVVIVFATLGGLLPYFYCSLGDIILTMRSKNHINIISVIIAAFAATYSFAIAIADKDAFYESYVLILLVGVIYIYNSRKVNIDL